MEHIPALKRAAAEPQQERFVKAKIWHDNETFLQVPVAYAVTDCNLCDSFQTVEI